MWFACDPKGIVLAMTLFMARDQLKIGTSSWVPIKIETSNSTHALVYIRYDLPGEISNKI